MKITAYKCRFTGKIFEEHERDKYVLHLRNLRTGMAGDRLEKKMESEWTTWLSAEKKKITHIDQIIPWFLTNQKKIMAKVNSQHKRESISDHCRFVLKSDEFDTLSFDLTWNPMCSNSHCAPDNGKTNWGSNPGAPLGYPGWKGTLKGNLKRLPRHNGAYPYNLAYELVGFKTGSGGGGNSHHEYGLTLFLDDWPGLGTQMEIENDEFRRTTKAVRDAKYEAEQELIIKKLKYQWA
jgi:hypothetical protein